MKTHWFSLISGFWDMTLESVWFPRVSPVLIFYIDICVYLCIFACLFVSGAFVLRCCTSIKINENNEPWKHHPNTLSFNLPGTISWWATVFFSHLRHQRKCFFYQAGSFAWLSFKESSQESHTSLICLFLLCPQTLLPSISRELNFTHVRKSLSEGW